MSVFEPFAALAALQRHGVRFVVIGGFAGRLLGSPTITNDTDVCYDRAPDNLERLAAALRELGARLRGVDEDVPFLLDVKTLQKGENFTFDTTAGSLDVLGLPAGVSGFHELMANSGVFELGDGLAVPVADIDDLIRMKRAAGRPKDRIELEVLAAVREEREALGLEGPG
jgi:hypothetical protein